MIKARHHFVIYPIFQWLTGCLLKRNFNFVQIVGEFHDHAQPVLIIANHISWWDGFWLLHLNLKVLHRRFHFMMLEEQLKKHWYFQYSGAYSVKKKSRSIVESITYTTQLLQNSENMVFMFPQGEINSLYNNTIQFEKGAQRIIEQCSENVQVLFVANLIDYFSNPKPNLYMYLKSYSVESLRANSVDSEYNSFYNSVLALQKSKTS